MSTGHERRTDGELGEGELGGGDFEPQVVTSRENFAAMDLEYARRAVAAMSPDLIAASAHTWHEVGDEIGTAAQDFVKTVSAGLGGWQGDAADHVGTALLRLGERMELLGEAATGVGGKVEEAWTGFAETKRLVELIPDPPVPIDVLRKRPFTNVKAADYECAEADMAAEQIMRTVYGTTVIAADTGVPIMPPPIPIGPWQ